MARNVRLDLKMATTLCQLKGHFGAVFLALFQCCGTNILRNYFRSPEVIFGQICNQLHKNESMITVEINASTKNLYIL